MQYINETGMPGLVFIGIGNGYAEYCEPVCYFIPDPEPIPYPA